MARSKRKTMVVVGLIVLALTVFALITMEFGDSWGSGQLRLPVGNGTPAISLGDTHGLILASDGSLWTWGSGSGLGLGNATHRSTSLRRVGHETNWVGISAQSTHNVAVRSDGTIWIWGKSV